VTSGGIVDACTGLFWESKDEFGTTCKFDFWDVMTFITAGDGFEDMT